MVFFFTQNSGQANVGTFGTFGVRVRVRAAFVSRALAAVRSRSYIRAPRVQGEIAMYLCGTYLLWPGGRGTW